MTRRVRTPHFIAGLGDGNVRDRMAPNRKNGIGTDDLFLHAPNSFDKRHVRRRDPTPKTQKYNMVPPFETMVDTSMPPTQGPWQVSAMALLCIMGLLLALFLHLITDSSTPSEKITYYRRKTKKKKTDEPSEWSDDQTRNYQADSETAHPLYYPYQPRFSQQQQHRHRKISGDAISSAGQSPVVINSRPYYHHNVSGSNSFPAPSSRTSPNVARKAASPAVGHGLEGFGTGATERNFAKPLSPVSSFASLSQTELTEKEDSTPERVPSATTFHSSNSSLFLSPGHEDFVTPKAGPRRRLALPKEGQIETAVPFSGTPAPLPFIPNLDKTPPDDDDTRNIMRMESGDYTTSSDDGAPSPTTFKAYPGHPSPLRKSESAPQQYRGGGITPNRALLEAHAVTPGPRANIKHKRPDLTLATDAAQSLQSGNIQFDELTLIEVIGGGGFGQVWKATWRGTPVAVKVLTGSAQVEQASPVLQEFAAEINLLKGMRHPNICLYMGACLDPPNRAIVTELASNGSLWDALRLPLQLPFTACDGVSMQGWNTSTPPPIGTWPWPLVKKVACGAARGMTYLHSGTPPVLHRDLKSANLLLDDSYTTKVCDFGLSRLKAQHASMTGNCGTVQWMAPEVLANQAYAEPADVYSFGIIAWEMLTRECPYEGQSAIQCALAVLNKDYRPPIPVWCPPELSALITACLSKDPAARPTFAQIILALDAMP